MLNMHGLSKLVSFLNETSILDHLSWAGSYTVFAPNNRALSELSAARKEAFKNDTALLEEIIKYHIALGVYKHADLINDKKLRSLQDDEIRINVYKARHATTAEGCQIVNFDNIASDGVIHVINEVMLPPDGRIADILAIDPEFSIFYSLINGTKFIDLLNDNLLTLFAPNNAAFQNQPSTTIPQIQADPALKEAIVKYHAVRGILWTPGMHNGKLRTLSDDASDLLTVKLKHLHITVQKAQIINRDISANNGVIHTIDTVLFPPSKNVIG
ncbi:Hypothetical predicted protein [Octopus vulgaris]|uniref:FAS1 domain-containing protein n=1 Tax=Octopus vulgaris TaxID=6645 RepID=A0AA36BED4_OCTVU|nr:Hypothetical predicted protein [Octopus vulgaris]